LLKQKVRQKFERFRCNPESVFCLSNSLKEKTIFIHASDTNIEDAVHKTGEILQNISSTYLNTRSMLVLILSVVVAYIVGRVMATFLRRTVNVIGRQADRSQNLKTVNRLRRYETFLILSIAALRTMLILFGIYFWWMYIHPYGQAPGIIGASALLLVILSGALGPPLRDISAGSAMMAEHWYGIGDHIRVEPFIDMQGVVERVTLRSTRIRGLNGEVVWINNQHIQAVRLAPKGIRTIALEMFVDDLEVGEALITKTNKRLPTGPLLVVTPLTIISSDKVGDSLWHITAVGETAAGREWLIEQSAVDLIKWMDEQSKKPVLAHGPLARYADAEAERRFSRTIKNAKKRPTPSRRDAKKDKKQGS
jgi:hypothetical protein